MSFSLPLIQELDPLPDVAEALRRFAEWPDCVLFDSASQRPELGRYSFLTADPFEFEELASVPLGVDPFARLRAWSQRFQAASVRCIMRCIRRGMRCILRMFLLKIAGCGLVRWTI